MAETAASMSASRPDSRGQPRKSLGGIWLEFLGSMNLAITLLVVVSIASVIGTVLPQNETFNTYLIQFGPFWFEVFRVLNLYDVYSASWFLFILGFLILSTGICVSRHIPSVWREITRYRTRVREQSLLALRQHRHWDSAHSTGELQDVAEAAFQAHGYRTRTEARGDIVVVAGMKGAATRIGYVLTHVAVVVIAIGALVDGNLYLKFQEFTGNLQIETRDLRVSQVPAESWVAAESGAFRGNVTIPEGASSEVSFLQMRDGYLVQELPFTIEVEQFRIDYFPNGAPRSYESDLVIHDPTLDEPIRETIGVNYPLTHRGHTIYQASFTDGGSSLYLTGHLLDGSGQVMELDARVFETYDLQLGGLERELRIDGFELLNINRDTRSVERTGGSSEFINSGPSYTFTLRDEAGQAREYRNYMAPVEIEDRWYFLHGMRTGAEEPFRYLHIPADHNYSMDTFLAFHQALHRPEAVASASRRAADGLLGQMGVPGSELGDRVAGTAHGMIDTLLTRGFGGVSAELDERAAGASRPGMIREFSEAVLQRTLYEVYRDVLADQQGVMPASIQTDSRQRAFFEEAMNAVSAAAEYGAPLIFQLNHFEHRQATGLQITRAPGKSIVYTGSALLTIGVFLLFYVSQRRVWALVKPGQTGGGELLMGGANQRRPEQFEEEFEQLADAVDQHLNPADDPAREN